MNKIVAVIFVFVILSATTVSAQNACDSTAPKAAAKVVRGARGSVGPMGPAGPATEIPQWMYYTVGASLMFGLLGMILGIAALARHPYVVHPAPMVINNAPPAHPQT